MSSAQTVTALTKGLWLKCMGSIVTVLVAMRH